MEDTSAAEAEIRELPESILLAIEGAAALNQTTETLAAPVDDTNGVVEARDFAAMNPQQSRRLEATNADLQRLEQHFGAAMDRNIKTLPGQGSVEPTPWPSSYWPTFQDGINFVWRTGEPSASEKYAMAHGLDPKKFADTVSQTTGIDSMRNRRSCQSDGECSSLGDGSRCGRPRRCIRWPLHPRLVRYLPCVGARSDHGTGATLPCDSQRSHVPPVRHQGAHDGALRRRQSADGLHGRALQRPRQRANNRDQYGRFRDATRRDIGPGFFHIAIGKHHGSPTAVVHCRRGCRLRGLEPAREELRCDREQQDDTARCRVALLSYEHVPVQPVGAQHPVHKNRFTWVVESNEDGALVATGRAGPSLKSEDYSYLLELDGDDNIIGGEWVGSSHTSHPDFLWFPTTKPAATLVTSVGLSYQNVSNLLAMSLQAQC
ncbi:hypothetical protein PINS_up023780 [Pythium insidiosum]|nr:hypothetical protein PINS_up023780 [Pythium insidiosum]